MEIEIWEIDRVVPYERNPRRGGSVAKVAASLREFGWTGSPLVVDEDSVLLAGHTRLAASRSLGLARVPVYVKRGLSPEQRIAVRIADNRSAEDSDWDWGLLGGEISALLGADYDLSVLGLETDELALAGIGDEATTAPDEVAAARALQERFDAPPFSVLDARSGYWQRRKKAWLDLGILGEIGRIGDEEILAPTPDRGSADGEPGSPPPRARRDRARAGGRARATDARPKPE